MEYYIFYKLYEPQQCLQLKIQRRLHRLNLKHHQWQYLDIFYENVAFYQDVWVILDFIFYNV